MTSTVYVDAITGATVAAIALAVIILGMFCVAKEYRHKRLAMQHDERQKALSREHELMRLDQGRQIKEIERDTQALRAASHPREITRHDG